MKKTILLSICLCLYGLTLAWADVIYISGDVSGTWSADSVIVTDEVRVPPGETLVIEPGVKVLFAGHYKLIVDSIATLTALGVLGDSIQFTPIDTSSGWHSLRFLNASPACSLTFCILEYGKANAGSGEDYNGGAIYCYNSNPKIIRCAILKSNATVKGSGLYCKNSNPLVSENLFWGNAGPTWGGAICCSNNSNPLIKNNTIIGNTANQGGGISCLSSNPDIIGNYIAGN